MQYIGQHQFLMLLLVVEADFDQWRDRLQGVLAGLMKEFHHRRVDVPAVGGDFSALGRSDGRAGGGAPRSGADIVGVEQDRRSRGERAVASTVFAEQELLEEPGGMGAVPFRRAGVRHRLDQLAPASRGAARRSVSLRTVR